MVISTDSKVYLLFVIYLALYLGHLFIVVKQFYVKSSQPIGVTRVVYLANNLLLLALIIDTSVFPFIADLRYLFYGLTVTIISQLALIHLNFYYHQDNQFAIAKAADVTWERIEIDALYIELNKEKFDEEELDYLYRLLETKNRTAIFNSHFSFHKNKTPTER
jgi:hypothetical protein